MFTVKSLLTDTSLIRTPCVGPGRYYYYIYCNYTPYKTDTSLRRTTDTLKPSTDTCEVVFLVKNTSKRNVSAENDSKLRTDYASKILIT